MKERKIDLKTATVPSFLTPQIIEQIVEENEELYREQISNLEAEYGGKFVTDKALYLRLIEALNIVTKRLGKYPEKAITLADFPAEHFYAIQLTFWVPVLQANIKKWYFIRSPKLFIVGGKA